MKLLVTDVSMPPTTPGPLVLLFSAIDINDIIVLSGENPILSEICSALVVVKSVILHQ